MLTDPQALQLRNRLSGFLEKPVDLIITDNRCSMITFRWHNGRLELRLHNMFLLADLPFVRVLASFCEKPTPANRAVVAHFIDEHSRLINHAVHKNANLTRLRHKGRHHDLLELFDRVNARYFKRSCDAKISWGKTGSGRKRRSIMLGSYDYENNIIRLHPSLDVDWAPRYVLETLIYHEILHWLFRPRHDGERRVLHGRAFREAERAHPNYQKTNDWVETNIHRLLKPQSRLAPLQCR